MNAWYNDNDAYCCAWLRNLIAAGHLPDGEVDERSIEEIQPHEVGDTAHFFAGIGGWPYALRLAGWPDDRPVWTGSCPCQPFSAAGRLGGLGDKRHLWPAFRSLIAERRPATVFGEQVASKAGRQWLAGVRVDLERMGYAVGAADLPAACVGAPHIRQRLFWVADLPSGRFGIDGRAPGKPRHANERGAVGSMANAERDGGRRDQPERGTQGRTADGRAGARHCAVGDAELQRARRGEPGVEGQSRRWRGGLADAGETGPLGNTAEPGCEGAEPELQQSEQAEGRLSAGPGFWSDFALIPCADGKARRIEPGTFPLANGIPARVGKLRAYGNAIVPQAAAEFVMAYMEAMQCAG